MGDLPNFLKFTSGDLWIDFICTKELNFTKLSHSALKDIQSKSVSYDNTARTLVSLKKCPVVSNVFSIKGIAKDLVPF
jgi:hypothetical protein